MSAAPPAIALFDGVCVFCSAAVRFLLARDRAGRLRFAALQSPAGREILVRAGLPADAGESMVLVEGERVSTGSTAALRALRLLPLPWRVLSVLRVIPRPLRDALYDAFATRRYRWFGRRAACFVPGAAERERFLA